MRSSVIKTVFVFILIFLTVSCDYHQTRTTLKEAESLLQDHPDSALAILSQMPKESLQIRKYRAKYDLLYALSLDKNYIDIPDDSLARYALDFFSRTKDSYHEMLSWYALGLAQRNAGNTSGAAVSFTQAEALSRRVGNHHYQGLAARCLGDLYLGALDGASAKKWYEISETAFLDSGENRYAAYAKYAQATCLQNLLEFNQAEIILDSLMRECKDTDDYLYSQILLTRAANELLRKDGCFEDSIRMLKERQRITREKPECLEACYLSMVYAKLGQKDSSAFYQAMACNLMQSPVDSARIYYLLYLSEERQKDYVSANRNLVQSMEIQNRMMNVRQSMSIANSLNFYHQEQNKIIVMATEKKRQLWLLFFFLSVSVVIILLQRVAAHRKEIREKDRIIRENQERLQEDLVRIGDITEEFSSYKMAASSEMSALIERSLKDQLNLINKWSHAYYLLTSAEESEEKDPYRHLDADYVSKKEAALADFQNALNSLRQDQALFDRIEESVNVWKNGLMKRLRETFPPKGKKGGITEKDYRILTLLYARFPENVTAYLVGMNHGALRMRKSHFKRFFKEQGESVAGEFLHELG